MSKIFETLRFRRPKYSAFDLSHEKKLSCSMAELIPVFVEEIVPGDHFKVNTEVMLRFSPLIAPVMHRVNVYVHYFYVPNRIIWNEWEDFITGGKDGDSAPTMPTLVADASGSAAGTLGDYLGINNNNPGGGNTQSVIQLPFRAYQTIYNEYYRDPTLHGVVDITNVNSLKVLRKRCWEKDYFTSALPWTQRGQEVGVPITFNPKSGMPDQVWNVLDNPPELTTVADVLEVNSSGNLFGANTGSGSELASIDNTDSLDITINDLRQTARLQEWLEKNARGGYRYIEQLLSHFGVKSSDSRLQRPEYLGGGRQPVVISEVLNTSATATQAQGTMAGHGISVGTANRTSKRFEEHGWIFGIMSVLPRTNYQQGIDRKFQRTDKLDYYFPEFANLGEQEVLSKELFYDSTDSHDDNNAVFGYQQRFAEYKYGCSKVHGDFRSTLNFWHLGRIFSGRPSLNSTFVEADPATRIFAVGTGDTLWCQVFNNVKARRPMPYFANPKL